MDGCVIVLGGNNSPQSVGPLRVLVLVVQDFEEEGCEDLADRNGVIFGRLPDDGSEL